MNENPLTHNPMKQEDASKRKTLVIVAVSALSVIALAGIVYSAFTWQHNRQLSDDLAAKNKQIATLKKQDSTSGKPTTSPVDPYAGWQSTTLKYEKISLKYPSTWNVTNTSKPGGSTGDITPGSDQIKLTSSTGLTVVIDTGVSGLGDGPYGNREVLATPITTLGGNYFLGFGTYGSGAPTDQSTTGEGIIGTAATRDATWPTGKNTRSSVGGTSIVISMAYYDASGHATVKKVSDFQNDTSYNDALLIIKSLSY